ncbi:MAG: hypothetical protein MZV64_15780 [Ignavibacteriales bacterium]|nr:hypothetical protein [Ignavibacteriales bacterium]
MRTYIGGNVAVTGDVSVTTTIMTEADALASAITGGAIAVGATPASATIRSEAEAAIRSGASVTSTSGNVSLTAANNLRRRQVHFRQGRQRFDQDGHRRRRGGLGQRPDGNRGGGGFG